MASRQIPPPASETLVRLPMTQATWQAVAARLFLSPRQMRIVELILCGQQDKEIAASLELSIPTIRTYLSRVYERTQVHDRLELVLKVFALAQEQLGDAKCRS